MNKAIFNLSWAGNFGDNLLFSTLPELYNKNGLDFYLNENTLFRNDEIKKLVWDYNPYVKGITKEPPNIIVNKEIITNVIKSNCIENVEYANGFIGSGNKYPVIYYKPKLIESLNNSTILALDTISQSPYYNDNYLSNIITKITDNDNVLLLKYRKNIGGSALAHYNYNSNILYVEDIFHHCDIIASCKKYITIQSGSAVLASAIIGNSHNNKAYVILSQETKNLVIINNIFRFDNLNYVY